MSASNPSRAGLDAEHLARVRVFIAAVDWTQAKTVREYPHFYIVRSRLAKRMAEEFDWLSELIRPGL